MGNDNTPQVQPRVLVKLERMVKKAIEEKQAGDKIDWDLGPIFSPDQPPMYYISLAIPGAIIGSSQMAGFLVPDAHHQSQEFITQAVYNALNALREARTKELTGASTVVPDLILAK
jgi:hypothetical protein